MGRSRRICRTVAWGLVVAMQAGALAQGTRDTTTYRRIKAELDAIPAIDTHDHLWPFDRLPGLRGDRRGKGMNLSSLWRSSYYTWINPLTPWTPGETFDAWWGKAKHDFDDARATELLPLPAPRVHGPLRRRLRPDHRRPGPRPRTTGSSTTTATEAGCTTSSPSGPTSS